MAKQYTFADKYKDLKKLYNKNNRLDQNDPITVKSFNKEVESLKAEQESVKAQMQQMQSPQPQQPMNMGQTPNIPGGFKYGGSMRNKMEDGGYFFTYSGQSDPKKGRNQSYSTKKVSLKANDYNSMKQANDAYTKWKPKLQEAYNRLGRDLTDKEVQNLLGAEAYKELNQAKTSLSNISNKYGIPATSFGFNEGDFGDPNAPQMFGPRYNAENWTVSDNSGKSVLGNANLPVNAGEYETYQKQIDPYQIDPKYDIAGTIAATRPLLDDFKTDQMSFDRAKPGYVDYGNARRQATQEAGTAVNVGLNNLRNTGASAGQAAANALALQTGMNSNVNKMLSASHEAEANQNAGIYGNNQLANAGIQRAEAVQNYGDRRYVDEANFNRKSQIGRNILELTQAQKRDNMDELGLQLSKPGYMIDSNGRLQATKGYTPVTGVQTSPVNTLDTYDGVTPYTPSYGEITQSPSNYDGVTPYNKQYEPTLYKQGGSMTNPYRDMALEIIKKRCGGKLKK